MMIVSPSVPPLRDPNSRNPVRRWYIQASLDFRRIVPEQTSDRQVLEQDVSSQRLRERRAVLGHPTKPVESNL